MDPGYVFRMHKRVRKQADVAAQACEHRQRMKPMQHGKLMCSSMGSSRGRVLAMAGKKMEAYVSCEAYASPRLLTLQTRTDLQPR